MDPTFQYAGGVRIPPKQFQLRNRIERNSKDMVNLNTYKHIETDVPDFTYNFPKLTYAKGRTYETPLNRSIGYSHTLEKKTRDIYGFDISYNDAKTDRDISYNNIRQPIEQQIDVSKGYKKPEYKIANIPYLDMSPQNTRYDARDYKQSQPFVAGGPDLAYNPYFDRYDPVTDPRNVIRELRSAVYEDKGGDQGYEESQKKLKRHFENRWVPEELITDDLMDTFLRHDTVLPQIKGDNKYSMLNTKKGLFDPKTFKSPDTCGSIPKLKTIKPTVTMKDQINLLLEKQKLETKETKEIKEIKETKEIKEIKEIKETKEIKNVYTIPSIKSSTSSKLLDSILTIHPENTKITGNVNGSEILHFKEHIEIFKNELHNLTGIHLTDSNITETVISIEIDTNDPLLSDNHSKNQYHKYSIQIQNSEPHITIKASNLIGISHATSTLLQLIHSDRISDARIKMGNINDFSDSNYSSIFIDLNKYSIDIKQIIDICRFYKIPYIHIQGLTNDGNIFYFENELSFLQNDNYDNEYWVDIINYAETRGVTLIPGIDILNTKISKFSNDIGLETTYDFIIKIIDQLLITFKNTPYIFVGFDKLYINKASQNKDFFLKHPEIPKYDSNALFQYFVYRINNYIRSKDKRMISWENMNSRVLYANTNNTIIANVLTYSNVKNYNEEIISYINNNINVIQAPIHSSLEDAYNWSIHSSPKNMGSSYILNNDKNYLIKLIIQQFKTYSIKKTIQYNTFIENLLYIQNIFISSNNGFRLIEDGLDNLYYIENDYGILYTYSNILRLTIIINNENLKVHYSINSINSIKYTEPIEFNGYIYNDIINVYFQAYTNDDKPYGNIIHKQYICLPFSIKMNGTKGNSMTKYFNKKANIYIKPLLDGRIHFDFNKVSEKSPILPLDSQITITTTTNPLYIALFDKNNKIYGSTYKVNMICNENNKVMNIYTITKYQPIYIEKVYKLSTNIKTIQSIIQSILTGVNNDTVNIEVIVVGGGSNSSSGGIATEIYKNVPVSIGINIEVGMPFKQSSVSFTDFYNPTMAYQGTGSLQGLITKGNPTFSSNGYNYNGINFGAPGYQGIVILKITD